MIQSTALRSTPDLPVAAAPVELSGALADHLLHPCYILRVAGEPAEALRALDTGETDRLWREASDLRAAVAAEIPERCRALEAVVPGLGDKDAVRAALNAKRALFRNKPAGAAALAALHGRIDREEMARLAALDGALVRLAAIEVESLAAFEREMAHGEAVMPALLKAPNMRAALSYSNPEFLAKADRVIGGGRGDAKTRRNVEDSLVQYHARSSTKTSPLSSFTVIRVGHWRDGGGDPWAVDYPAALDRRVAFKAGLARHLMAPLLARFDVASALFPLRRNPSARLSEGRVRLTGVTPGQEASGRTWGTGVTVTQLDANALVQLVDHAFKMNADAPMRADAIAASVCTLAPKLTPAAVLPMLQRLFDVQYLCADTGFVEQEDALAWAMRIVADPAFPGGAAISAALARIAAALDVTRGRDDAARAAAVSEIRREVGAVAVLTGADPDGPHAKPAFYENCYLGEGDAELDRAGLEPFGDDLALLQELSFLLDPNQELAARMADFFVARFGADGVCDDVSSFLERFDAVYAPGVLDAKIDQDGAAPLSPHTEAWLRATRAFDAYLEPHLNGSADIQLEADAMRGILSLIPSGVARRSTSYSYVVQTARENGHNKLVLNQVFGGRSSIMSRFLEVLDEPSLTDVRQYLRAGSSAGRHAELGGVFGFNANRHPALAAEEVMVPPFPPAFADTGKIDLGRLRLAYAADRHRLFFITPEGEEIDVWYQGLLIPSLLPQLHRVLSLAFTEGPSFAITKALVMRSMQPGRTVSYVPRISLGEVVLFRRTWLIAHAEAPDATLPAAHFYLAARQWAARLGLPNRFFLRALPLRDAAPDGAPPAAIDWGGVNFKDMKPFYVDLASPRLVRVMANMMKRNDLALCVSELLPDFDQHPTTVEGRRHVAELHFELTRPAVPAAPPVPAWFTVRIAYFDEDRRALMTGPVADAIAAARAEPGVERLFLLPHWKFGPHLDLSIKAEPDTMNLRLFPKLRAILGGWLSAHPSTAAVDPVAYDALSRRIGMFELDQGPYLPLLRDNSVALVPYERPRTLVLPAFAESREEMLSDSLDIATALYGRKAADADGVMMALVAMLAGVADTYAEGMSEGYMSLRSHADYFFAAHDTAGQVRARFDAIDARRAAETDAVIAAVAARSPDALPFDDGLRALMTRWWTILDRTDARNRAIVDAQYDVLVGQNIHMDMADAMKSGAPDDLRGAFSQRKISAIGDVFLNTERGRAAQRTHAFLTFRTNVNFFYALLPILEVAPMQKFLLCHLVANAVERVFAQDWRAKINLAVAE